MPGETSSASADTVKHSPIIIMDIKYLIKKLLTLTGANSPSSVTTQ